MSTAVRVALAPDGVLHYAIPCRPEDLPGVPPRALSNAWEAARAAAAAELWGPHRALFFAGDRHQDGAILTLADADAACWAEAVDRLAGLDTLAGLALCLRLLALVDLLGRARWMAGLFAIGRDGIEIHPALLAAAATTGLDGAGRFDETVMKRLLSSRVAGTSAGRGVEAG
ncbi:hypothetical protein [Roseomonas marmotae]|uniref:Uncharacterized protein n=1 Tax=Roseomonas marmotae TaxID=2768161 RepID=A0ABS3KL26_9PROT|nr:hypothetical protein [Roseomonas marmotae]MBO1077031.1 hypothetical protein [Roseomonas marmotae]QTI78429.1 hypothetical protein IAI58_12100 [Roseomonas marmotae]